MESEIESEENEELEQPEEHRGMSKEDESMQLEQNENFMNNGNK